MPAAAEPPLPVPEQTVAAIASEESGVAAKRKLDNLTLHHRARAGRQAYLAALDCIEALSFD